jgi:hypothetical protein
MNTLTCYISGMDDTDIVYEHFTCYTSGMYDTDIVYEYFNMLY